MTSTNTNQATQNELTQFGLPYNVFCLTVSILACQYIIVIKSILFDVLKHFGLAWFYAFFIFEVSVIVTIHEIELFEGKTFNAGMEER